MVGANDSDSNQIKKSVLLRYPFTFYEEVSRQLIIYKTFRGNKRVYKALPVMDELVDFCTIDPMTGRRVYELKEGSYNEDRFIFIPKNLVEEFRALWHGPRYDRIPALKMLAPGPTMNPKDDVVYIKSLVPFKEAWGDRPVEYTAFQAGFAYKVQQMSPAGFPMTETIPMVNWNRPDEVDVTYTNSIPYAMWTEYFEKGWQDMAPICTRIEKICAQKLESKGIMSGEAPMGGSGGGSSGSPSEPDTEGEEVGDDFML